MAVKSPMEYFQEQDFSLASPQGGEQGEISPTERQFFRKYLGVEDPRELASLPKTEAQTVLQVEAPEPTTEKTSSPSAPAPSVSAPEKTSPAAPEEDASTEQFRNAEEKAVEEIIHDSEIVTEVDSRDSSGGKASSVSAIEKWLESTPGESVDEKLRTLETVTTVGFYVGNEVFVVPIDSVLEVIHYTALHRLPQAPSFLPGVVNLRGSILPVINMVEMLTLQGRELPDERGLIIICEARGMRLGLLVSRLHTIHKAKQDKFNWNAELHLGSSAELLSGLLETDEKLLGILSVERLVAKLLEG